jgi:hypothetical protein
MVRAGLILSAALLLLLAAMTVKGALIALPSPPHAPSGAGFDAHRAADRLARVLGDESAHPVDSDANDAVRARLIAEMRSAGLEPRVTDGFACNGFARYRAVACARVRNVVATIVPAAAVARGRPHLMLSAHCDGTFAGPGAADAGIGIATLLETAALIRGREIARPVTFLFNEGEEMGLIGARDFLDRDPLAPRIGALLNFEARGVTGPATMFETSRPNAAAIARFARAADRPLANSMTTDLYRLIPNSTDVAVFEERDWTILNFAIIGNETRYHSPGDDLAALDRRSLQHMGDQAVALTVDFATREAPAAQGERLYADLLGRQLVTMPAAFGLVMLVILLIFFLLESWRRRALGRPLGAFAIAMAGAGAVALIGQLILGLIRAGDYMRGHPWVTELAVYGSAMAAGLVALRLIAREAEIGKLRAAYWLFFLLLGAGLASVAPGGTVYFLFPPLIAGLGMSIERWRPGAERIGALLALLLLFLSFGPALSLFEELMSNGPHWMFAPIGALILLPALVELRPLMNRVPPSRLDAAAAALFVLPWIAVALTPAYSEDRQQLFTLEHVADTDSGQAWWAVNNDGAPVPYAGRWERIELPHTPRRRWALAAPAFDAPAPEVERVGEVRTAQGRRVRLRLRTRGAEAVSLVAPAEAPLRGAGVPGRLRPLGRGSGEDKRIVRCIGRSCDGALIELDLAGTAPVELTLIGTRTGLPPQGAALAAQRPRLARPQYAPDSSIAVRRVRL